MSRIGIITIHRTPSYGGCLQSFALFQYLKNIGHDVEIIDLLRPTHPEYKDSRRFVRMRMSYSKRIRFCLRRILGLNINKSTSKTYNINFEKFNEKISLSKTYFGIDELYANPPRYDIYLTGSDQVWNPIQPYALEPYFLTFVKKNMGKKISYAASVGLSELLPEEKKLFKKWIEDYDVVSVRETEIQNYLSKFIEKKIARVADPTFLLSRQEWMKIATIPSITKPYILLFKLSTKQQLIDYCKQLAEQANMELVVLGQCEVADSTYIVVNDAGPSEFIGYFVKAEMVITDSFHGTVFSIIMNSKNFFSYISKGNIKGSRITDLLLHHNISDHLLNQELDQDWKELTKIQLDRETVDKQYLIEQAMSRDFLLENIK